MPVTAINPTDRINLGGRYSIDTLYNYYRQQNGYLSVYEKFLEDSDISNVALSEFAESGMPTMVADTVATNLGYHPSQVWSDWSSKANRSREEVLDELLEDLDVSSVLPIYSSNNGKYRIGTEAIIRQIIATNQDKIITPDRVAEAMNKVISAHIPDYSNQVRNDTIEGKVRDILDKITMESYGLLSSICESSSLLTKMPYLGQAIEKYQYSSSAETKLDSTRPLPFILLSIYKKKVFIPTPALAKLVDANQDRLSDIENLLTSYFKTDSLVSAAA